MLVEFLRLGRDRIVHGLDGRNQRVLHAIGRRDVHGRRKRVIRRLRHVDVVVGMNRLLRSHFAAGDFDGAVGDDLVHVHVGLGAAAGLPDAQRELVVELAGDDFVGGLHDQLGFVGGKLAQILIHQRAGFFEHAKGADQLRRHGVAANVEMQQGTLRLRAPVNIRRDFDLSHAVGFDAGLCFGGRGRFGKSGHDEISSVQPKSEHPDASAGMRNRVLYGGVKGKARGLVSCRHCAKMAQGWGTHVLIPFSFQPLCHIRGHLRTLILRTRSERGVTPGTA